MRSSFLQVLFTLCALILIAAGVWISSEDLHRRPRERPPAPAPEPPPEAPVELPPDPEPEPKADFEGRIESFDAWMARCRGTASRFPPGTPEYERLARSLRQLMATDPPLLRKAALVLAEDITLDPFTQSMIVDAIARSDDPAGADAALRNLLSHESAGEAAKASVLAGIASMRRITPVMARELISMAKSPGRLSAPALETLGALYGASDAVPTESKAALLGCVIARHREFLASEDSEGLQSSLKSLARTGSAEARTEIRSALKHANAAIRCASIRAWSSLRLPEGPDLLLEVLSTERNATARVEAVQGLYPAPGRGPGAAARTREGEVIEQLLAICREDPDEKVRHSALGYFGRRFDVAHPPPDKAIDAIEKLKRSDASATNREYAEWLLRERYGITP